MSTVISKFTSKPEIRNLLSYPLISIRKITNEENFYFFLNLINQKSEIRNQKSTFCLMLNSIEQLIV